jgi:serine/threonine protein phosphatase PrpC
MSSPADLVCPACGTTTLADDRFCEACGLAAPRPPDHVEIPGADVAAVSDRGLVHDRNEDAIAVRADSTIGIVVCDGVSNSAAPHVAASVAATTIAALLGTCPIGDAVAAADAAVRDVPWSGTGPDAPASTVVAATWDGSSVHVAWAGDSRAYWVDRGGAVSRLTTDHSLVAEGGPAAAGAGAHLITRWLGDGAPDEPPAAATFTPSTPGLLVACTDGLWNLVADDAIGAVVAAAGGHRAGEVAARLVTSAIAAGGHDHVSVAVLDIAPGGRDHP